MLSTDVRLPSAFFHASLWRGRWRLFEDQAGDELGLGRGVLDVIADGLTIAADIEHDVLDDLDGAPGRQRSHPHLDAVGRLVVAGLHHGS
jgi:hypothetical protein